MTGNATENQYAEMYTLSKKLEKGAKVTISFDAVSNVPTKFTIQNDGGNGGSWLPYISDTADTTKKHYEATITLDEFSDKGVGMRLDNVPATTTVTVSNMKLVLG